MTAPTSFPLPQEIRLSPTKDMLTISFDTGEKVSLPAELLRVESPSAEVQGHAPDQKKTPAGKANVRIKDIEPVGNYAVRLGFDDGHDTGLFSWALLYDYGMRKDELMHAYEARLAAEGLSR